MWETDARLLRRVPRIALASLGMGAALWLARPLFRPMLEGGILTDYLALLLVSVVGLVVYAVLAFGTGATRLSELRGTALPKAKTPAP